MGEVVPSCILMNMVVELEKVVVLGIVVRNEQVLIVKRTKREVGKNDRVLAWGFPGGKVELNETEENAVVREVYEETGFSTRVGRLISERSHPDFPVRALYFSCHLISDAPDVVDDRGTEEIRWVAPADLGAYFTSELDSAVRDYLFDLDK